MQFKLIDFMQFKLMKENYRQNIFFSDFECKKLSYR